MDMDVTAPGSGFEGLLLDSSIAGARPKARLTEDELFALKIQRRRKQDSERRARLQNSKNAISCDKEMLDLQVAEMRARREEERQFNISGDQGLLGANRAVVQAQKEATRKKAEELRATRDHNLEQSAMRHADNTAEKLGRLNDPPARDGDLDARCGAASMQKFAGEDLMKAERVRAQRLMQVDCIEQQKFEKAMLNRMDHEEDRKFADEVAEMTRIRNEMEDEDLQLRKELNRAGLQEHERMAENASQQRQRQKDSEQALDNMEMEFVRHEGFTAESGQQYLQNGRVRRTEFKGKTREERLVAKQDVLQQATEKELTREMQRQSDRADNVEARKVHSVLESLERQKQRSRKAMAVQCREENLRMQEEARLRKKETDKLFANQVSPAFYEQFGVDAR